jgi:IPT/TIG domain-containing protein
LNSFLPKCFLILLAVCSGIALPQTLPPRVFFSDLESGPNTGGENNGGAYVTLYGRNFGATRGGGSVSIGGGAAAAYPIWTDTKITVQLGALATTGNLVVTTAVGASNGVPFTVRTGSIFFVATTGSDSNAGSFASPWRTVLKARDTMQAGDITYARDGVSQTTEDGQGWNAAMLLRTGGTAGRPKALVAYPGATVTIGNINGPNSGIRSTDYSASGGAAPGYWVFAGLLLRGKNEGMVLAGPSSTWRVVGNDFTCPNGNGASACFETSQTSGVKFLGNNVHDTGIATASALYHGVYFSTDSSHIEMGWSKVSNVHGCRGVQIHSSPLGPGGASDPTGYNQYDISIHDNVIHDTQCDGIVIATVDPSKGKVEAYNNVIYNAGKGPANAENSGNWSCIYVTGTTNNGPAGSGTVEIYNNTLYNCGTFASPPWNDAKNAIENGGANPDIKVRIRNNIIYQPPGVHYLTIFVKNKKLPCDDADNCDGINGSNNLFFGNGPAPLNTNIVDSLSADPLLLNLDLSQLQLTVVSPAIDSGTNTEISADQDGILRPQGAAYDLGAFEFVPIVDQSSPLPGIPEVKVKRSAKSRLQRRTR